MLAFYACAVITAASAFTSLGFSLAAVKQTHTAARTDAMYAAARSVALAMASIVPFFSHSIVWLESIAVVMIVVQSIDAGIGVYNHDSLKSYGPMATAALNLSALIWLVAS